MTPEQRAESLIWNPQTALRRDLNKLIADAIRAAALEEREACAKELDYLAIKRSEYGFSDASLQWAARIIRQRKRQPEELPVAIGGEGK